MPLIGDRRGEVDAEATTEPAPATMRERLDVAMVAWTDAGNVMLWGDNERDRFLDFIAKKLEGS